MNRLTRWALVLGLVLSGGAFAQAFEEGTNYLPVLPAPPQGAVGDKIEVAEFFMYSCPHCDHFEPFVQEWLKTKADDLEFVQVPAMFGRQANLHAQAFYALQVIGELDRVHHAFFDEIHRKDNRLLTRDDLDAFIASQGVNMDEFAAAMSSFAVATKTNQATALLRRYGISGVPAIVVDGRYKSARGLTYESLIELADFLAQKVREERQAAQP